MASDSKPSPWLPVADALARGAAGAMIHAPVPGAARVLLVDDLIATGGTAIAAVNLLQKIGAEIVDRKSVV